MRYVLKTLLRVFKRASTDITYKDIILELYEFSAVYKTEIFKTHF